MQTIQLLDSKSRYIPTSLLLLTATVLFFIAPSKTLASDQEPSNICQNGSYLLRTLDSESEDDFCAKYQGNVVLIVNTASRCAFTDQYDNLEKLYTRYKEKGLVVAGFPSNDFANQEPGNEKQIKNFCRLTYGVQFPMYAKTTVIGDDAAPIYQSLKRASGNSPGWNFHKYLIGRRGEFITDFTSSTDPLSQKVTQAIEQAL